MGDATNLLLTLDLAPVPDRTNFVDGSIKLSAQDSKLAGRAQPTPASPRNGVTR